ncbi:MAG: calcium/sodium antiporter, partial [Gammaproteobacteria bacterium]|nr:calcium/sodium antiporter [Gammaproteobacteria bacterium]
MLVDIALTLTGFVLLVGGADRFVAGAASTARILGVPPVIIGLTIVGFATSAPEVLVSVSAATSGLTGMAVGNALGSNVANVGLVLAAAAIIEPIRGDLSGTLRRELQVLVAVSVGASLLFVDLTLSRLDGLLLLCGLVAFFVWVVRNSQRIPQDDPVIEEAVKELPAEMSRRRAVTYLLLGFGVLLLGAELLVAGAESLAQRFGLSDLIIGLTIVAIGTSLPE